MKMRARLAMTVVVGCLAMLTAAWAQDGPQLSPPGPATTATVPEATAPAGAPLTKDNVEAWLDGFLPYALRTADIAGAVVVVVKDGQVLTQKGYGYSDVAARTPVD